MDTFLYTQLLKEFVHQHLTLSNNFKSPQSNPIPYNIYI